VVLEFLLKNATYPFQVEALFLGLSNWYTCAIVLWQIICVSLLWLLEHHFLSMMIAPLQLSWL